MVKAVLALTSSSVQLQCCHPLTHSTCVLQAFLESLASSVCHVHSRFPRAHVAELETLQQAPKGQCRAGGGTTQLGPVGSIASRLFCESSLGTAGTAVVHVTWASDYIMLSMIVLP
jgi:hypothetical protein